MVTVERLDAEQLSKHLPELVEIFRDVVNNGAAVGYLPPLSSQEAQEYWLSIMPEIADQTRLLLIASLDQRLVGTVQLALATRPNGLHRAEVQKLLVHSQYRQQGIGRALMESLEKHARTADRSLLVLDTRRGDAGEQLYLKLGYIEAGSIPGYARSADGSLHDTVVFYRQL